MEKVWKALVGLVIIFALLGYGVSAVNDGPAWMPPDMLLFLLFVVMGAIVIWMIR